MLLNSNRESVSIIEAAEITGVSRRTIYNWLAEKKVDGFRTPGGCVRIYTDTLFKDLGSFKGKWKTKKELE